MLHSHAYNFMLPPADLSHVNRTLLSGSEVQQTSATVLAVCFCSNIHVGYHNLHVYTVKDSLCWEV